jgi:hypothetical protein
MYWWPLISIRILVEIAADVGAIRSRALDAGHCATAWMRRHWSQVWSQWRGVNA